MLKAIPPSLVLLVRSKLLIVTPGKLSKASRDMFLLKITPSKLVPSAVTRKAEVEMVHSKLGLCNRKVAKDVNLNGGVR